MLKLLLPWLFRRLDRGLKGMAGAEGDGAPRPSASKLACYRRAREAVASLQQRHPRHAAPEEALQTLDYLIALETGAIRDQSRLDKLDFAWLIQRTAGLDREVAARLVEASKEADNLSWYG